MLIEMMEIDINDIGYHWRTEESVKESVGVRSKLQMKEI